MTRTSADLSRHVSALCAAFKIRLIVNPKAPPDQAMSARTTRGVDVIGIHPVIDETTYAVALHEVGHVQHPLGRLKWAEGSTDLKKTKRVSSARDVRLQIESEEAAWEWARHHALEWTPVMERVAEMCLMSYYDHARRLMVVVRRDK